MIPQRKKFYIAGPMTGIPQFNFPAFDVAAASLRSYGYLVVSPVELDEPSARAAALSNETGDPEQYNADTGETWGDLLARDVKMIADEVSGVVALEGWEDSKGARLEVFVARTCGKPVYSYEEWLNDPTPGAPLTEEFLIPDWEINDVMHENVFGGDKFEQPKLETRRVTFPVCSPETVSKLKKAEEKLKAESALSDAMRKAVQGAFEKTNGKGRQIGWVNSCEIEAGSERAMGGDRTIREVDSPFPDARMYEAVKKPSALSPKELEDMEQKIADKVEEQGAKGFVNHGEVRVTSETGGQKGRKPQRMDLLPPEALLALSEVYGMGAEKYDDHNYLKGYDWSLSFGALLRHVMAAEKGEWLDDESGLPHVMHAAWHCFALFLFEKHGIGTDDRIKTVVEGVRS
jgi:hypothetical protein